MVNAAKFYNTWMDTVTSSYPFQTHGSSLKSKKQKNAPRFEDVSLPLGVWQARMDSRSTNDGKAQTALKKILERKVPYRNMKLIICNDLLLH